MSFIKRADGTTVYGGTHDTVRSIGGGRKNSSTNENDEGWMLSVEASMVSFGEAINADEEEGYELAEQLWDGVYEGDCKYITRESFEGYFRPAGR